MKKILAKIDMWDMWLLTLIAVCLGFVLLAMNASAGALESAGSLIDKIPDGTGMWMSVLSMVLGDVFFRFKATQKPLSIAHLVAKWLHVIAVGAEKLAKFLDMLLPQKLAEPPAAPSTQGEVSQK